MSNEICIGENFMNKIRINGYFKNSELNHPIIYDCGGAQFNNIISFKHENNRIKLKINNNNLIFTIEDEETILTYNFISGQKTNNNSYKLKKENLVAYLEIETKTIEIKENSILVKFIIIDSNEQAELKIDYKVV